MAALLACMMPMGLGSHDVGNTACNTVTGASVKNRRIFESCDERPLGGLSSSTWAPDVFLQKERHNEIRGVSFKSQLVSPY